MKKQGNDTQAEQFKQSAGEDLERLVTRIEEIIDMPMMETLVLFEGMSVGELRGYRTLLQQKVDELDVLGKALVESQRELSSTSERVQLGSVFSLVMKTMDRMGAIDYHLGKKRLTR